MRGPGRQKVLGGVASPAGFGKPPLNVTGGAGYNETIVATAEMRCMIRVRIGCILMALTAVLAPAPPGPAAGEDLSPIRLAREVPPPAPPPPPAHAFPPPPNRPP